MTEEKENCNFQQNYNVFGLDDKPCCYLYHKYCDEIDNCYFKRCKRLEQENKKIKKQYNCYACGNCKGKEDYINLEKHHKGLRKQFDILVKRNNELSLRIEQLEQENKELKEENIEYDEELAIEKLSHKSDLETLEQYRSALEEIREVIYYCGHKDIVDKVLPKINEVLNEK